MKILRKLAFIGLAASLAACAANSLRLETAASVSKASTAVVDQARATIAQARQRREEATATLVASDPSCMPLTSLQLLVPGPGWTVNTPRAPLCASGPTPPFGYRIQPVSLNSIPDESLQPTVLLIGAMADYGAAMAKIVERPTVDIAEELNAIASKASEALALANGLAGANIPDPFKLLAEEQRTAAVALLQFAVNLAAEAERVRDVRRLLERDGARVEALVPELQRQLERWSTISATGDAQIVVNNLTRAYESQRAQMDFERRLAFVRLVTQSRADLAAVAPRRAAMDAALVAFAEVHADLRRHLAGNFTPEERREIVRRNRSRILEGLQLIARTMVAFGVTL